MVILLLKKSGVMVALPHADKFGLANSSRVHRLMVVGDTKATGAKKVNF